MTGGGRRIIMGVLLSVRRSRGVGSSASVAIERVRQGLRHCCLIFIIGKLQIKDPGSCNIIP